MVWCHLSAATTRPSSSRGFCGQNETGHGRLRGRLRTLRRGWSFRFFDIKIWPNFDKLRRISQFIRFGRLVEGPAEQTGTRLKPSVDSSPLQNSSKTVWERSELNWQAGQHVRVNANEAFQRRQFCLRDLASWLVAGYSRTEISRHFEDLTRGHFYI